MKSMKIIQNIFFAMSAFALAACSGGGGSGDDPQDAQAGSSSLKLDMRAPASTTFVTQSAEGTVRIENASPNDRTFTVSTTNVVLAEGNTTLEIEKWGVETLAWTHVCNEVGAVDLSIRVRDQHDDEAVRTTLDCEGVGDPELLANASTIQAETLEAATGILTIRNPSEIERTLEVTLWQGAFIREETGPDAETIADASRSMRVTLGPTSGRSQDIRFYHRCRSALFETYQATVADDWGRSELDIKVDCGPVPLDILTPEVSARVGGHQLDRRGQFPIWIANRAQTRDGIAPESLIMQASTSAGLTLHVRSATDTADSNAAPVTRFEIMPGEVWGGVLTQTCDSDSQSQIEGVLHLNNESLSRQQSIRTRLVCDQSLSDFSVSVSHGALDVRVLETGYGVLTIDNPKDGALEAEILIENNSDGGFLFDGASAVTLHAMNLPARSRQTIPYGYHCSQIGRNDMDISILIRNDADTGGIRQSHLEQISVLCQAPAIDITASRFVPDIADTGQNSAWSEININTRIADERYPSGRQPNTLTFTWREHPPASVLRIYEAPAWESCIQQREREPGAQCTNTFTNPTVSLQRTDSQRFFAEWNCRDAEQDMSIFRFSLQNSGYDVEPIDQRIELPCDAWPVRSTGNTVLEGQVGDTLTGSIELTNPSDFPRRMTLTLWDGARWQSSGSATTTALIPAKDTSSSQRYTYACDAMTDETYSITISDDLASSEHQVRVVCGEAISPEIVSIEAPQGLVGANAEGIIVLRNHTEHDSNFRLTLWHGATWAPDGGRTKTITVDAEETSLYADGTYNHACTVALNARPHRIMARTSGWEGALDIPVTCQGERPGPVLRSIQRPQGMLDESAEGALTIGNPTAVERTFTVSLWEGATFTNGSRTQEVRLDGNETSTEISYTHFCHEPIDWLFPLRAGDDTGNTQIQVRVTCQDNQPIYVRPNRIDMTVSNEDTDRTGYGDIHIERSLGNTDNADIDVMLSVLTEANDPFRIEERACTGSCESMSSVMLTQANDFRFAGRVKWACPESVQSEQALNGYIRVNSDGLNEPISIPVSLTCESTANRGVEISLDDNTLESRVFEIVYSNLNIVNIGDEAITGQISSDTGFVEYQGRTEKDNQYLAINLPANSRTILSYGYACRAEETDQSMKLTIRLNAGTSRLGKTIEKDVAVRCNAANIDAGMPDGFVRDVEVDPNDPDKLTSSYTLRNSVWAEWTLDTNIPEDSGNSEEQPAIVRIFWQINDDQNKIDIHTPENWRACRRARSDHNLLPVDDNVLPDDAPDPEVCDSYLTPYIDMRLMDTERYILEWQCSAPVADQPKLIWNIGNIGYIGEPREIDLNIGQVCPQ